MSQKQIKKLRREKENRLKKTVETEKILPIFQIIKNNWKFLVLVLIGTTLLYLNSLQGNFVSDDYATIPNNPLITNFVHGFKGWMGGLMNWFLAVNFGTKSPIPYHIFSLFLYLLVIVAVFIFLRLVANKRTSYIGTVLFAVLPIHVEAVAWIAGRPYLLNALFVLLSLISFIYFLKTEKKKYLWTFFVLVFLTFAAEKTRSTALPLLAILYWTSFDHKLKKKINLGKLLLVFGFLFFIIILVLWPQMMTRIQSVNSGINASSSIFYSPFFQYPTSITKYLQLMWMPVDLTLYHTMYNIPVWMNWLVLLIYLFSVVYFFFKNKKIFFALAFIFVAAAPSMAPVKISWLVAERYIFLGSVGFVMFLGIIFDQIWKKNKIITITLLVILTSAYGVRVVLRNRDWQTNHSLWVNTCQVSPNSHNAWNNIGDDYDKLKQYENAIKGFRQSTIVKTNYADAYHNMANILIKINRLDLARAAYEKGLSYNPNLFQSYLSLIQISLMEKNYDSAMKNILVLKKMQPNSVQVWFAEAVVYSQMGKKEEAKVILKQIVNQFPDHKQASDLLLQLDR